MEGKKSVILLQEGEERGLLTRKACGGGQEGHHSLSPHQSTMLGSRAMEKGEEGDSNGL